MTVFELLEVIDLIPRHRPVLFLVPNASTSVFMLEGQLFQPGDKLPMVARQDADDGSLVFELEWEKK